MKPGWPKCGPRASLFHRFTGTIVYTEPVPLKYGKLATKYPQIYGYFLQYNVLTCSRILPVAASGLFSSAAPRQSSSRYGMAQIAGVDNGGVESRGGG